MTTAAPEPRRILIVDDCTTSRMIEDLILRRGGYEILLAADGDQAVAMARRLAPEIILLDLQMPKLSGLEVLKELKRSAETRNVPVIVVTTSADPVARRAATEWGCAGFLTKPFQSMALLLAVETSLAARERTRAPMADVG